MTATTDRWIRALLIGAWTFVLDAIAIALGGTVPVLQEILAPRDYDSWHADTKLIVGVGGIIAGVAFGVMFCWMMRQVSNIRPRISYKAVALLSMAGPYVALMPFAQRRFAPRGAEIAFFKPSAMVAGPVRHGVSGLGCRNFLDSDTLDSRIVSATCPDHGLSIGQHNVGRFGDGPDAS